jgi:uncharacterized protein
MGVDAVKLRVDDITSEAREISFAEPEQEINRTLGHGPVREYQLAAPVQVALSYYRAGTDLFVAGEVAARTTASCARCAEEFPAIRRRPFRYVLAPQVIGYDNEPDLRADDLEFTLYEGDEIDLTPLVREQVLLALTDRPLCREDCRGLCARCGENLNVHECGCQLERFDPRLAVLRSLKVGRS